MGNMYLPEIENTQEFKEIQKLAEEHERVRKEINDLLLRQKTLSEESKMFVNKLSKSIVRL